MNAFFWSRRKPSKELVLKVDALLTQIFPDDKLEDALAAFKGANESRESGDGVVTPVEDVEDDGSEALPAAADGRQERSSPRARIESVDAADETHDDGDGDSADTPVEEETSDQSGEDEESAAKSLPEEMEEVWAKIRSVFHTWDENEVERERKMRRMSELLLRFHVLEKMLIPKVLSAMTFETRKYVSHVFRAMIIQDLEGFVEYIADRPEIVKWLVEGYKDNATALICGSMLRHCFDHEVLAALFLNEMPAELEVLVRVAKTNANFDIAADAFTSVSKLLLEHKAIASSCLDSSFSRIFSQLNGLLSSPSYVTKRQALQLLAELLLDPINFQVMQRYVASKDNLKDVMLLLRQPSHALRMDAFHVFKIFVANPNKSAEVETLLMRNREKLLNFVREFGKNETSRDFQQERSLLVFTLQRMADRDQLERQQTAPPPLKTSSSVAEGASSLASPASPSISLRKSLSEVCAHQHARDAGGAVPTLVALCLDKLARGAPPRALAFITRRLPEELVVDLLQRMIASNSITDDRLVTFFTSARRVLRLEGCTSIRNSILRQIPMRCPQLRCLDLSNCAQVNNTVVRAVLQGCPQLQTLRLDGCRHITDAAFQPDQEPLRACATLQSVSFARCAQLTGELVMYLVLACRALTTVNLSRCKRIPSDAIRHLLGSARALRHATLSFMELTDAAFLDTAASPVALPRGLLTIDLTQSRVTDAALVALAAQSRALEQVTLSYCLEITDVGLEALVRACPRIRQLDLNNCGLLTDRGVATLGVHGQQLEAVNLSWCMNMTDKGVVDLVQGCARLRQLKLVWCTQLTDVTLRAVAATRRPALTLHLSGCKGVSPSSVTHARAVGVEVVGQ
ncbi:hypothetical protein P43SY_009269 [Pythium insidiosum]|uniref:F-box/LRR-repeat protein 15-like leucin rich repeat domain-containing protein n=1 Tax=Pythium insidiosum TaxID=114742 RepID=A0AAD5M3Z4_PYTIN|nr:hypothetical protein P43SY_009269 [Pythium insidiosum]